MRALACLPLLAGCTQLLGLDNLHQNAAPTDDAAPAPDLATDDGAGGPPITIRGTATLTESLMAAQEPIANMTIELLRVSDESVVTSTTTDGAGAFSLTVAAGSDVMLRGTTGQPPFAVVIPAAPPTADADFSFSLFNDQALAQVGSLCPGNPNGIDPNLGQVLVKLVDASNTPQAGYSITSAQPGELTCYPLSSGSGATNSQGLAIVFDVVPSLDQITAIDPTGPAGQSPVWAIPARSQSFVELRVPTHATP